MNRHGEIHFNTRSDRTSRAVSAINWVSSSFHALDDVGVVEMTQTRIKRCWAIVYRWLTICWTLAATRASYGRMQS